MPIENVSDTARWVAVYRAMETARPDAIFRDPFAERLAGERGQAIVREMKQGRQMAWAMIVRTAVLDEMILERIANDGIDTVVTLAAGLATRAWRLKLPPTLQWFDVDLPAMTAYKAEAMRGEKPACRYEAIAVDLTSDTARDEVLRRLGGVARSALVVTEGLLIYLAPAQVESLARALHAQTHQVVDRRPREPAAAGVDEQVLGQEGGGRERAVPVRPRRQQRILRGARLARSAVPLRDGGGPSVEARDAVHVALASARTPRVTGAT